MTGRKRPSAFRFVRISTKSLHSMNARIFAALAICFFIGVANVLAAEQEAGLKREPSGFVYPVGVANRRFVDQNGKVYLLKTMSSWAIAQNCTDAEITQASEGLKALDFNAVTVSPFG